LGRFALINKTPLKTYYGRNQAGPKQIADNILLYTRIFF